MSASSVFQPALPMNLSHPPPATMLVNLDVLDMEEKASAAQMERVLSIVRTNTERMIRLVDNLFQLTTEKSSEMCEEVIIKIEDTGIGIPKEECERIFEPFYRVDQSRSRSIGGAGLGLALVKDIVEKHRGTIQVHSKAGQGSEFILYL